MEKTLEIIHCTKGLNLAQVSKLPGVADLPLMVRGPFCQALIAEGNGDMEKAKERLEIAVHLEEKQNTI